MYFYKQKGKQVLDLRGDLILTHNDNLVTGRIKSAAPAAVRNGKYITAIPGMKLRDKLRATKAAIGFIWGGSQALTKQDIDAEGI